MDILLNPTPLTTAILALCAGFLFTVLIIFNGRKTPERKYHPIAGTILNQLINFNRLHDYMTELAQKYTSYRLLGLFRSEVYTSDPANVEYILKTNFSNYGKVCTLY